MQRNLLRFPVAACLLLFAMRGMADANVIVNGSFEQPDISSGGTYETFTAGDTGILGWTVFGQSVDIVSGGSYGGAAAGSQMLDLDGTPGPGGVMQAFATNPGTEYAFSFAYRRSGRSATVSLLDSSGDLVTPISIAGSSDWVTFADTFIAREGTTILKFLSNTSSGNDGLYLDAVSVVATSAVVPEPGSLALLACGGLGIVGGWVRKRRSAVAAA